VKEGIVVLQTYPYVLLVVGGESLEPGRRLRETIFKIGSFMALKDIILEIGPAIGEIIGTFAEGVMSVSPRHCAAHLLVPKQRVPFAAIDPRVLRLVGLPRSTDDDYYNRNGHLLDRADGVLVLPGDDGTLTELRAAVKDKEKPAIVLSGPGLAVRAAKNDPEIADKALFCDTAEEIDKAISRQLALHNKEARRVGAS
jgi:hypothetical protein